MKILFVNHSLGRTGAPLVLKHIIEWFNKNNSSIQCDVFSLIDGELKKDFDKFSAKHFVNIYSDNIFLRSCRKIFRLVGIISLDRNFVYSFKIKKLANRNYDMIYHNTIVGLESSIEIKKRHKGTKLLVHVHELNTEIIKYCPNFKDLDEKVDHYIAASNLVKNNLVESHQINPGKISVVYEFSNVEINNQKSVNSTVRIGGSGYGSYRKGIDLFIEVARCLKNNADFEFKMEWLGTINQKDLIIYDSLLKSYGLRNQVVFSGFSENVGAFYSTLDIFLMTSREDPFPLVCIEAGSSGIPIFCFKGCTGTEEVLTKYEELIINDFDYNQMSLNIIDLVKNQTRYSQVSNELKEIFEEFTPNNQVPKIFDIIDNLYNQI